MSFPIIRWQIKSLRSIDVSSSANFKAANRGMMLTGGTAKKGNGEYWKLRPGSLGEVSRTTYAYSTIVGPDAWLRHRKHLALMADSP